ncbi:hypothetical protein DFH08DRAFT_867654 [Mycena albidolilacea]|uniref:Uncharacterized protein n=1 Tax=Mycena albidolilacea TaxID=1033008 RepID=A0AAD7A0R5_9AGAR|nr:hypothetical protein DFH08DRAFT_867654 [Mycena albidolilacea]
MRDIPEPFVILLRPSHASRSAIWRASSSAITPEMTSRVVRRDQCSILDNATRNSPCNLNTGTICHGSEQCACSGISYFLAAACQVCTNGANISWDQFAVSSSGHCSGLPQPFPSLPPEEDPNHVIPSWVVVMASATPTPSTFDLAVASAIATSLAAGPQNTLDSTPTTNSHNPSPTSASITTTTSSSRSTADPESSSSTAASTPVASSVNNTTPTTNAPAPSVILSQSVSSGGNPTPSPTGSNGSTLSTQGKTVHTGAIVGSVIAVCTILSLAAVLFWLWRRRRRSRGAYRDSIPVFPSPSSDGPSAIFPAASSLANKSRGDLEKELRTARERLFDMESIGPPVSASRRELDAESPSAGPDVIAELREMRVRIRELEDQMQSAGALGLVDEESPPGYSKEDRR